MKFVNTISFRVFLGVLEMTLLFYPYKGFPEFYMFVKQIK